MFDEQPDGDPHGECAAEIHRLQKEHDALRAVLVAFKNATPTGFAGWHDKYAGAIKLAERVLTGLKDGPPPDWLDALPVVAHGFMGERDGKSVGYQVFAGDGPDTQDKLVKLSDVRAALGVMGTPADQLLRDLVDAHAEWDALHWSQRNQPGAADKLLEARRKARDYVATRGVKGPDDVR